MFLDLPNHWSPPERPRSNRSPPQLTAQQEKLIGWIIGFNVVMLFLAPIGGATLFDAVLAMLKG